MLATTEERFHHRSVLVVGYYCNTVMNGVAISRVRAVGGGGGGDFFWNCDTVIVNPDTMDDYLVRTLIPAAGNAPSAWKALTAETRK